MAKQVFKAKRVEADVWKAKRVEVDVTLGGGA